VLKQMGIGGGEFSTAAALGMNEDFRSGGDPSIKPFKQSNNEYLHRILNDCRCKLLTSPSVPHSAGSLVGHWHLAVDYVDLASASFFWWPGPWAVRPVAVHDI
jgi:hypothetical protein